MPFVAPATRNAPLAPAARRLSRKTFSLIPLITPGARATPSLTSPLTTLKTREPPTPFTFPRYSIFDGFHRERKWQHANAVIGRGVKAPFPIPARVLGQAANLGALLEISSTRGECTTTVPDSSTYVTLRPLPSVINSQVGPILKVDARESGFILGTRDPLLLLLLLVRFTRENEILLVRLIRASLKKGCRSLADGDVSLCPDYASDRIKTADGELSAFRISSASFSGQKKGRRRRRKRRLLKGYLISRRRTGVPRARIHLASINSGAAIYLDNPWKINAAPRAISSTRFKRVESKRRTSCV